MSHKILFASSEVFPLIKTGGLADVSQSLPTALKQLGHDIRIVLPAYPQAKHKLKHLNACAKLSIYGMEIVIHESMLPNTNIPIYLIECSDLFERDGNPYTDEQGVPWHDNAQRFTQFCRAIVKLAINQAQLNWQPDIVHCNDWHTGLACPLLHYEDNRPKILFTVHNLAYQGLFSHKIFTQLQLPEELWRYDRVEFNGELSFIKAGIVYADHVNTVSPTYAKEIQTPEYGSGLEAVLNYHSGKLSGIVNGIDTKEWNPESDKYIEYKYTLKNIEKKSLNKTSLQKELKLPAEKNTPLFSVISRIAEQKGIDLLIEILPDVIALGTQVVILGTGDKKLEANLSELHKEFNNNIVVKIDFDEILAHKITASADFFIMPSRYEPCGLNQMYCQRYGTIPIVRKTGGLVDTVIGYSENKSNLTSTGIIFDEANPNDLFNAIKLALRIYKNNADMKKIKENALTQDFSWKKSAHEYESLYINITK